MRNVRSKGNISQEEYQRHYFIFNDERIDKIKNQIVAYLIGYLERDKNANTKKYNWKIEIENEF